MLDPEDVMDYSGDADEIVEEMKANLTATVEVLKKKESFRSRFISLMDDINTYGKLMYSTYLLEQRSHTLSPWITGGPWKKMSHLLFFINI